MASSSALEGLRDELREQCQYAVQLGNAVSEFKLEDLMRKMSRLLSGPNATEAVKEGECTHPEVLLAYLATLKSCLRGIVRCLGELRKQPKSLQPATDRRGPPTLLSLAVLRVIYTVLELFWGLLLQEPVEELLGCRLTDAVHPKSLLVSAQTLQQLKGVGIHAAESEAERWEYLELMHDVIRNDSFTAMMQERNLRRVASALLVFSDSSGERNMLENLLSDRNLQPMLIRELASLLPDCNSRCKDLISAIFVKILLADDGLRAIVYG